MTKAANRKVHEAALKGTRTDSQTEKAKKRKIIKNQPVILTDYSSAERKLVTKVFKAAKHKVREAALKGMQSDSKTEKARKKKLIENQPASLKIQLAEDMKVRRLFFSD